jgi:hypothetical protein
VVHPNIASLNGAAENRMLPRAGSADEFAGIERGANAAHFAVIESVRCTIMPFVATICKRANLID